MAKTTVTHITDDLDGSKDAKEVSFAYDGTQYTVDLTDKNRRALEKLLKPYIDAGTRIATSRSGRRKSSAGRSSRADLAAIRAWAKENGFQISDRGRVSADIIEAYDSAS